MWFQKNKWKIIVPILIIAVLAAAFYFGGNAPGSKGWEIDNNGPTVSTTSEAEPTKTPVPDNTPEPTPVPTPDVSAKPENISISTPEQTGTPEQNDSPEQADTPEQNTSPEQISTPMPTPPPAQTQAPAPAAPTPVPTPSPTPAPAPPQPTMQINPETGKDKYLTDPVPEGKPLPVEPQDVTIGSTAFTCTISISCSTILNNMDLCDPAKKDLVPVDGWILRPITVTFYEGESVFNVLQRVCKQQKIHMEFENTPIYNSAYIEGIHNLYEFDVGELSGWMYKVNEWFPNYGCSRYALRNGDVICWVYTCDLGSDVGGGYATGNGMD